MKKGDTLNLTGKTLKGKNITSLFGQVWLVTDIGDWVAFSSKKGPWCFIETGHRNSSRCVHSIDNRDFDIEIIDPQPNDQED